MIFINFFIKVREINQKYLDGLRVLSSSKKIQDLKILHIIYSMLCMRNILNIYISDRWEIRLLNALNNFRKENKDPIFLLIFLNSLIKLTY